LLLFARHDFACVIELQQGLITTLTSLSFKAWHIFSNGCQERLHRGGRCTSQSLVVRSTT